MIILVGDKYKLGGLAEVLKDRLNEDVIYVSEKDNILKQENEIIAIKEASFIIYDTYQYYNEAHELIDIMKRIYNVNKAKIILYVPTIEPKNEIIKEASLRQIKNYISSSQSMGSQKDRLEKILSGFYEANVEEFVSEAEKQALKEHQRLNEFVGELYSAKQREEEKENTIIIKKKTQTEVILGFLVGMFKIVFSIISIILMSIALISLFYTEVREPLFKVLLDIYSNVIAGFK